MSAVAQSAGLWRRRLRSGLGVIAVLFLTSAILRLEGLETQIMQLLVANASSADTAELTADTDALLAEIRLRSEQLDAREAALQAREDELADIETALAEQLDELSAVEERISRLVETADGAADENIARLVLIFENMKAEEATGLFAEMRPDFAAGFLRRMNPERAAAILAGLSAEEAYAVSVILASQNAANIVE